MWGCIRMGCFENGGGVGAGAVGKGTAEKKVIGNSATVQQHLTFYCSRSLRVYPCGRNIYQNNIHVCSQTFLTSSRK